MGEIVWNRTYFVDEATHGVAVRRANDDPNGYVMVGQTEDFAGTPPNIYVMRVDPLGNPIWTNVYGQGPGRRYISKVEIKNCDTGYIVVGAVDSPAEGGHLGMLLRIDDLGNLVWMKLYKRTGTPFDQTNFKDVEQLSGGGFIVTGHSQTLIEPFGGPFQIVHDTILLETDSLGVPVWGMQYQNMQTDNSGESLTILPQGYAVVGQSFDKSLGGASTTELLSTDATGNLLWNRQLFGQIDGGSHFKGFLANGTLRDLPNGDLVFPGGGLDDQNASLIRFDSLGTFQAAESFGGPNWQHATSMYVEPAGAGYTFCGPSSDGLNNDYMLVRTDAAFQSGCSVGPVAPVVDTEVITELPIDYTIIELTNTTPRVPIEPPLAWDEELICEGSPCLDPVGITCGVTGLAVTISWPPLPGSVVAAELWRNGSFLANVLGSTSFADSPPFGTSIYELIISDGSPVCDPATSTCTAFVGVSFPPLVGHTDVLVAPWKPFVDEPIICWGDFLTQKGRDPRITNTISDINPDLGSDVPGVTGIVWLSLGDFPDRHVVTQEEGQHLATFLANGGSLYIEGGDVAFGSQTVLAQLSGCVAIDDGDILGEVPGLTGLDSGVGIDASALSALYRGTGRSVDHLAPAGNGAGVLFQSTGPEAQGTSVYYDASVSGSGSHRMITSSTSFEGYAGDPSLLLDLYLDALSPQTTLPITFLRGDGNGDGVLDIADAIYALSYLFSSGPGACLDALDTNDDGSADIGDPISFLAFQFSGGTPPQAPYPQCGDDPTSDPLDCATQPGCP